MRSFDLNRAGKKNSARMGVQKDKKTLVNEHETEIAKKLGGRRQPVSGALAGFRGDIKLDRFLIESKETKHSSLTLAATDIVKICREAEAERKYPGLVITLGKTADLVPKEWVAVPLDVFAYMIAKGMGEIE